MLVKRYKVVARYRVPSGDVYDTSFNIEIHVDNGFGRYMVNEVYDDRLIRDASEILKEMEVKVGYSPDFFNDPLKYLMEVYRRNYVDMVEDNTYLLSLKNVIEHIIIRDILGYGILTPFLADDGVEDIVLSAPGMPIQVWHRDFPELGWLLTNIVVDEGDVERLISKLAFRAGKSISILQPVMEGVLPEGYRVNATWMDEVSPRGSSFTIRKFRANPFKVRDLVDNGFIPSYIAALLKYLTLHRRFIMIIGPSGSGKTTLLNALLMEIPSNFRIVTIEETPEINLGDRPGWKPLSTRWDMDPASEMERLLRLVLRERADYIAVGESRGREARLVFQAAATGHGCLTTFHASSIRELEARLTSKPINIDVDMMRLLDAVVVLELLGVKGVRRVKEVYLRSGDRWINVYRPGLDRKSSYKAMERAVDGGLDRIQEIEEAINGGGVDGSNV